MVASAIVHTRSICDMKGIERCYTESAHLVSIWLIRYRCGVVYEVGSREDRLREVA